MNYFALLTVLAAAGIIVGDRLLLRRTMNRLDRMLNDGIAGRFTEANFDESRFSAVESKLYRYLSACSSSEANLSEEKARIQTMIADISHQTKTPIANILLYAGLLGEQPLPEGCPDLVAALGAQAEKLRFLIDALVKSGRLETGVIAVQPRRAALAPMMQAAAVQIQAAAENKGIALSYLPLEQTARFDPKWTQEALFNLLDNAVKYTPAGGRVSLSATPYELFCRIDVTDDGPGIPEVEQAQVFERFYRSPSVRDEQGVGLGLYLAREIAAAQGGYIKLASKPGSGSTFSLFVPI